MVNTVIRGSTAIMLPMVLVTVMLALVGCAPEPELSDGRYGAFYAIPDEFGWNDEVTIIVEGGELVDTGHLRRSAFGDVVRNGDIDHAMVLDEQTRSAAVHAALLDRVYRASLDGEEGYHRVDRSVVYRQKAFEPDPDGTVLRFSMRLSTQNGVIGVEDPVFHSIDAEQAHELDIFGEIGLTAEELADSIAGVYPVDEMRDLTRQLAELGGGREIDTLRHLIIRTIALTRIKEPEDPAAVLDSHEAQADAAHNEEAAVVSAHFLATEAGVEVLKAGGNAADAAVAVAAALSVVEPWFSSVLGGGTWAIYYDHEAGAVHSLDGVGPVPAMNTAEFFAPRAGQEGLHQAIVPGAWGGWIEWLKRFGSLPLGLILEPAIRLADEGFPASPELVNWLTIELDEIRERPHTREIYLSNGELPNVDESLRIPTLAETFRRLTDVYERNVGDYGHRGALAAAGDYYYRGPLAERVVDYSDEHDGTFALSDFSGFYGQLVEPIVTTYNGIEVYQNPPNSQGITMLIALNILREFDFSVFPGPDDPDVVHLITEALKLAHIDKYYHVGDPEWVDVPVAELLSTEHARERSEQIRMDSVLTWPVENLLPVDPAHAHTTTFQIVDAEGNAASTTTSLGAQFLVVGDTGIHINNRMRMLTVDEGDPNRVEPGKKVRHTSNPYMALRDGQPFILGGNTGVDTQPQGQVQQFIWTVEFGLSPQEAVSRPRFVTRAFPEAQYPWEAMNDLGMEEGTPQELIDALVERGHVVNSSGIFGNANMIVVDPEDGGVDLGADPRGGVNEGVLLPR